ncbi:MAG TPA: sulfur carrier protein ThiS [Candidatus Dormibacteraeota bacterium]|jgi:sulfur carrier protein|nr:sulfur carrier protein ThiS [Candidatus Dormibacteraeota bacterium]
MISLQINGKRVELEHPTRLLAYLDHLGVNPLAVAVEHNGTIIERSAYEAVTLRENDTVEIVRMVGGGKPSAGPTSP